MKIRKVLVLVLFFFLVGFAVPSDSKAIDLQQTLTSENSIITKIQEGVEYFFAFGVENKVQVLEKHAERRLEMAQEYANEGDGERVQNLIQNYMQIKEKQDGLLDRVDDQVLGAVAERTVEQQKTMEAIKTKTSNEVKNEVVQVQEQVVNQVAQRVVVANGTEGQTEFFEKVEHVWAPGTGPDGGESGVVVVGGTMQFAPGTSAGGPSGADIKTNVVVTGGGENNVVEGGHENEVSPDANPGVNTEVTTPGTENWVIDP